MITINDLCIQFGKRVLFQDVNLKFHSRQLLRYHWSQWSRKVYSTSCH